MNRRLMALATGCLVAACTVGAPTPPATPTITLTATVAVTVAPTPTVTVAATPTITVAPTPTPTPTPVPTPSPTAAPTPSPAQSFDVTGPFPNEAEALLVSYAAPDLQDTCLRKDAIIYDREVDTISCGEDDLPFDYSLIRTFDDLRRHYQQDISQSESPPEEGGTCAEGNYEASYEIGGEVAGRINCRLHTSSTTGTLYRVIEWTHEDLLVIGYISNRADVHTWEELITFWEERAGPFAPD